MSVEVSHETAVSKSAAIAIHLHPAVELTDEQFFLLCQINRDLMFERTAEEDSIVMPPTGFLTGDRNSEITMQLRAWAKCDGTGVRFARHLAAEHLIINSFNEEYIL